MEIRPILSALARNKTGAVLVALQVALSLAILANALYLVALRQGAAARPSGVAAEEQLIALYPHPVRALSFAETIAQQKQTVLALRAVPGVESVALANQSPLSLYGTRGGISASRTQSRTTLMAARYQSPDSLIQTWGLTLLEGRDFNAGEVQEIDNATSAEHARNVIVTRALAEALYPGAASVVNQPLYFGVGDDAAELRIVGVVERLQTPEAETGAAAELSLITPVRDADTDGMYAIRAAPGQRERVIRDAEAALRKVARGPLTVRVHTMQRDRIDRYRGDQAMSWMLVAVCALLLTVTGSGIVGIASLWVAQRQKQIGVRRALGARRVDILRYFITENFLITSAGVLGGVLLGLALNQLLVSRLELPRLPPAYLAAGAALFWLLGVAAVYGPARRGAAISPAAASRGA